MDKKEIIEFLNHEFETNELEITEKAQEFINKVANFIENEINYDEEDFDDDEEFYNDNDIEESIDYAITSLEYRNDLKEFLPSNAACDEIMSIAMDRNEDFYREETGTDKLSGISCFIVIWESSILRSLDEFLRYNLL